MFKNKCLDGLKQSPETLTRKNSSFHHFRYVLFVCSGVATGLMMMMRLSVTVALISMVNHTQIYLEEHPNASARELESNFRPDHVETGEFDWNNEKQETIITCYMITYTLFPIITTRFIMRFGLRKCIVILLLICALVTVLTPSMSHWGWRWLVVLRLVMGAAASGIVPGMVSLIELWAPTREAATGIVIYQFTGQIISVLTPLISGHLAQIDWRLVFYVPATATVFFCVIWLFLVSDEPGVSKLLSQKELDHIMETSPSGPEKIKPKAEVQNNNKQLEWLFMFRIKQFWYLAFIWCLYCATSGSMIYLLPNYLHSILKVPVQDVGTATFMVQIGSLFSMLWPNGTAELLRRLFSFSLTTARRLVVALCIFMATSTILYLAAYNQFIVPVIGIHRFFHTTHDTIFLATVLSNFGPTGTSGQVYSLLNSIGCVNSTIFCVIVGRFLDYTNDLVGCWSWVFITMALMNIAYLLVYSAFCHSDPVEIKSLQRSDDSSREV